MNGSDIPEEFIMTNYTNYFILENSDWFDVIGLYGWNRLTTEDDLYKTIKRMRRDTSANNPHTNGLKYDSGVDYLNYFYFIFKYAIENELFDSSCYTSVIEYGSAMNEIKNNAGFKNILKLYDDSVNINLYEDSKIHHFCNTFDFSGQTSFFYEHEMIENGYNFYDIYNFQYINMVLMLV